MNNKEGNILETNPNSISVEELERKKLEKIQRKERKKKEKKEFKKWLKEKENLSEPIKDKVLFSSDEEPRKALSTFFRNQNKVMVTSMALADRKAMIMIRLNSIIVSIVIVLYRYLNEGLVLGWLIGVILIVGTGGALILAILAAKPNQKFLTDLGEKEIYPTYSGLESRNFWIPSDVTLSDYEESMDKVVNSQELQIGNQVRFAYLIEKYLSSKYKLLDLSYNLFLVTMVAVCVTFLTCSTFLGI